MDPVTLGMAQADAKKKYAALAGHGNAIVWMGDSHTGIGAVPKIGDFGSIELGGMTQMIHSRVPALRYRYNAGIGGQTTTQMVARWTTDVVAKKPSVFHLLAGTNDITGGVLTEADTLANLQWMLREAKKLGCLCFIGTVPPRSDADTALDNIVRLNVGIKNLAAVEGAHLIDYHSVLVDSSTGRYKAGLSTDNVHSNATGQKLMAQTAAAVMNRVLPEGALPIPFSQFSGSPNRVPNCCFLTDTNSDGVPDFWTLGGTATTSTTSLVTDPDIVGKGMQLAFTGANNLNLTMSITNSVWSIGQTVAFCGKYKAIGVEAGSCLFSIGLAFNASTETNYTKLRPVNANSNVDTDGVGYFYAEARIPAGTNLIYAQMNAISGSGTLILGQPAMWVIDPTTGLAL